MFFDTEFVHSIYFRDFIFLSVNFTHLEEGAMKKKEENILLQCRFSRPNNRMYIEYGTYMCCRQKAIRFTPELLAHLGM